MKFLTFYTESHQILYEKFFLKSLKRSIPDCDIIAMRGSKQHCPSFTYHESGWAKTQSEKLKFVVDYCRTAPKDEILVFCDADIIFFKDFRDDIQKRLEGYDLVCQRAYSKRLVIKVDNILVKHSMCSGFYAFRNNDRCLKFLEKVQESIVSDDNADQTYFNNNKEMIHFEFLPDIYPNTGFFTSGKRYTGKIFNKDMLKDCMLLHCNWTSNFTEKLNLMEEVYSVYYE